MASDRYEIIPTNTNGWLSTGIHDDFIAGITHIKKGFEDRDVVLPNNRMKPIPPHLSLMPVWIRQMPYC